MADNRNGNAKLKIIYTYNVRSWTKNITGRGQKGDAYTGIYKLQSVFSVS